MRSYGERGGVGETQGGVRHELLWEAECAFDVAASIHGCMRL